MGVHIIDFRKFKTGYQGEGVALIDPSQSCICASRTADARVIRNACVTRACIHLYRISHEQLTIGFHNMNENVA
ncbi:hypothetical protein Y032_0530g3006 [Ancylostoma ceylanicum]|uniref:Uncharacterized protein n=1 Tax=Ancylostoma ceylanicum TaxID=53326 RepID=A0A016WTB4_9BILA|nr:hypothetical protein Y032_0530g3006 [Ancylostoma ceylanicum]